MEAKRKMTAQTPAPKKADLDGILQNLFNNYVFGVMLLYVASKLDLSFLEKTTIEATGPCSNASVELAPLFSGVSSLEQRPVLVAEYQGMLRRALLAETYEAIKWYCNHTSQFETFRAQPWYGFLYVLRNSLSHRRGGWLMWDEKVADPVTGQIRWCHLTFTKADAGKEIVLHDADIMLFIKDIHAFVATLA